MTVMEQAVEDRGGEDVVAEDRAPLRHDLVGGDQQAAAFVPAGDELEKEMRAASFKGQVAELVDLCGAPHKSTNATPAVMWSEEQPMAEYRAPAASRLHITGHLYSAASHSRIVASDRQAATAASSPSVGLALPRAARLASKSIAAYRWVVFGLA